MSALASQALAKSPRILGLSLFPDFLTVLSICRLQKRITEHHKELCATPEELPELPARTCPLPRKSLAYRDRYHIVELSNEKEPIYASYFEKYNSKADRLTHFMGNSNIPTAVREELIKKIEQLPQIQETGGKEPLDWNLTRWCKKYCAN